MAHESLGTEPDEVLYAMVGRGRFDAFEALVARHGRSLLGYCRKMVADADEEVSQETWLSLWKAAPSLAGKGPFRPLLYTSARRRCLNHIRGVRGKETVAIDPEERDPVSSPQLRLLLDAQSDKIVAAALAKLSPEKREAIALRFVDDLSYEEMAEIVGENVSTLRSRVYFALKDLRPMIARRLG